MRTGEREDIIASMKLFIDALDSAKFDSSYFKWAAISLHSATQSIMAFHLGFGNDLLVMSQEGAEAWLAAHHANTEYPETQMDGFLNLYKKVKKHEILGYKFTPKGQEGSSIKKLNLLRNEFIHFMPKGWSIEIAYMLEIFADCLSIIKDIGSGSISGRWEDEVQTETFQALVDESIEKVHQYTNH